MKYSIIVPTCRDKDQLKLIRDHLERFIEYDMDWDKCMDGGPEIIVTGLKASAATNRNYGLMQAKGDIIIMIDDDVLGFYPDWYDALAYPLAVPDDSKPDYLKNIVMISARLMKPDWSYGCMMDLDHNISTKDPFYTVKKRSLPSAAIAFRNDGTRFDEAYVGASFEDTDFCCQLQLKYPDGKFVINNDVQLIHLNEMKNQSSAWEINQRYFCKKWGDKLNDTSKE